MQSATTRLDTLVNYLDKKSKKPVRKIFDMTVKGYLVEDKIDEIKEAVYNEILFYYLTDLIDGCQMSVIIEDFSNELEHLKDVIGFNTSSSVVLSLAESMQPVLIYAESRLKNDKIKYNHIKRFVYMGLSYHDSRYIEMLAEQFLQEGIDEDKLISVINRFIIRNEVKVLKLKD